VECRPVRQRPAGHTPSLTRIKADRERNGLVRLGAAYGLAGDWASAATVLERAAVQPGGSALGGFLLAIAHHHLSRPAEARSDCDRARERLRNEKADDEARDVAVEVLAAIQGPERSRRRVALARRRVPRRPVRPVMPPEKRPTPKKPAPFESWRVVCGLVQAHLVRVRQRWTTSRINRG
jgi:hypothetical protein